MNCREAFKDISKYLDGELEAELKHILDVHLAKCPHCKVVFDTTQKTIALYCDGKLFSLPTDVRDRLHQALKRKCAQRAT
ncbi:MAG: anti-sigma factor family protein [Terriglobia bacterium]